MKWTLEDLLSDLPSQAPAPAASPPPGPASAQSEGEPPDDDEPDEDELGGDEAREETEGIVLLARLQPLLDMLIDQAWKNASPDQEGDFLVDPSDLVPGASAESLHETLHRLYRHARRWAPGLEVPFFVPPIRFQGVDASRAGDFQIDKEAYATVGVAPEFAGNAAVVPMILSHEACHHILYQSRLMRFDDIDLDEITTDLTMFVCGFGELVLRGQTHVRRYGAGSRSHLGYLPPAGYRLLHEHVLERRLRAGLPVRSLLGDLLDGARPERP